jgi:hypothetical protein
VFCTLDEQNLQLLMRAHHDSHSRLARAVVTFGNAR